LGYYLYFLLIIRVLYPEIEGYQDPVFKIIHTLFNLLSMSSPFIFLVSFVKIYKLNVDFSVRKL